MATDPRDPLDLLRDALAAININNQARLARYVVPGDVPAAVLAFNALPGRTVLDTVTGRIVEVVAVGMQHVVLPAGGGH